MRSPGSIRTSSSLPPVRCLRISMQNEGGVSGFSKLSSVRQTRAEPLRADSNRLYVSVRVRRVRTSSSRVGSNIFAILASVRAAFSSRAVRASVAASKAIVVPRSTSPSSSLRSMTPLLTGEALAVRSVSQRKRNLFAKGSPDRKDSPGRGRWHASAERGAAGER